MCNSAYIMLKLYILMFMIHKHNHNITIDNKHDPRGPLRTPPEPARGGRRPSLCA